MQYIGITDFTSKEEVKRIKTLFPPDIEHVPMIGVMMSYKTLYGIPSKWSSVWPAPEKLPGIFSEQTGVLNTLHFADYDLQSTSDDWIKVANMCGPHLHGFQYDIPWPHPLATEVFKSAFPEVTTVLQVGGVAFKKLGEPTPADIVKMLKRYGDAIDFTLFDLSGGKGQPMDAQKFVPFIDEIKDCLPNMQIAVAGGLGPSTAHLLQPLVDRYGNTFSVDAQGKLRKSGDAMDPIDWPLAYEYIEQVLNMLYAV